MNAWQRLLAASSLAIGTAWDLITHPRTGGGGTTYNTGVAVAITPSALSVAVSSPALSVTVAGAPLDVVLAANSPAVAVPSSNVVVTITTTPITV